MRRRDLIISLFGAASALWPLASIAQQRKVPTIGVLVVGSPGVEESHFAGNPYVLIQPDPPEGHMAGPKALLESLGNE